MRHGVPFACQRRPIVGVLRMCWLLPGSFDCFCCPHTSVHRPSIACLAVFLCGPGAFLHALSGPSTICPFPPHGWSAPDGLPLLLRKQPIWAAGDTPHLMPVEQGLPWHPVAARLAGQAIPFIVAASHAHALPSAPFWFSVPAVPVASPALLCPSSLSAVPALVPPGVAPAFWVSVLLLPLSGGAPGCPCRAPPPVPPACPPIRGFHFSIQRGLPRARLAVHFGGGGVFCPLSNSLGPVGAVSASVEPSKWHATVVLVGAGGSFHGFCCSPSTLRSSTPCRTAFPCGCGPTFHPSIQRHGGPPCASPPRWPTRGRKPPTTLWVAHMHGALLDGCGWGALCRWRVPLCG